MDAFESLVSRHEARIFGFVLRFCRNRADAAEITQDTFVSAYKGLTHYKHKSSFLSWLYTIARRKAIDHHRANPARAETPVSDLRAQESTEAGASAELLEAAEEVWRIARRILPARQFESLWLHYGEQLSIDEAAQVLNVTRTYVKVLLFRARRSLIRHRKNQTATQPNRSIPTLRLGTTNSQVP